jgi:phosphoribosylglycinamide formyltransferase 1
MKKIAIFASGTGTNAQRIIDHFKLSDQVQVALIFSNNPSAGVLEIAKKENIPYIIIEREKFYTSNYYQQLLKENNIQWIVLAGFLWKIPVELINAFPERIINIHPALLPKFGGKGMYGSKVHEAVIRAGDKESGITIHYVDEIYDHGKIIFQAISPISSDDDAASLAKKIHQLEYQHFPRVIERLLIDTKI